MRKEYQRLGSDYGNVFYAWVTVDENQPQQKIELKDSERQPCEVWTRVMGYFRPLSEFNQGKKAEFYERKYFNAEKINNQKAV